ncbi:MAG TPA: CmcJ/NvfI family oxidoreductase [Stellaceae bacterium]|jgi:hypothetical protein|nr:CmcJ/NvfI family oxidoreductase [Stellaceae bacterium]
MTQTMLAEADAAPDTIETQVNYFRDTGETPYTWSGGTGSTEVRSSNSIEAHRVTMHNGRRHAAGFVLTRDGFHFRRHDTRMKDFFDADEIARVYYPEMEALIKEESGAKRVLVFDHTLRTGDVDDREAKKIREPVQRVHNDYTEWSGPQRVRDLMGDEAETPLQRRFAIIQVWRPIRLPVESHPLAICDARSIAFDDFVISERRYPNRVGQTYSVKYDPRHLWYWFPRMRRDEAIVFKVYDSLKDGSARWTAHTSFDDPTSPPDARPRESIEIRTLAFF